MNPLKDNPFEAYFRLEDEIAMMDPTDDLNIFFKELKEVKSLTWGHNPLWWLHSFFSKLFIRAPRIVYEIDERSAMQPNGDFVSVDEIYIGPCRRKSTRKLQVSNDRVQKMRDAIRHHMLPRTKPSSEET